MPHILLVDDEPAQRQSLRRVLESQAMKVDEASSVAEAEERFEVQDFDLIITELRLPGEPGSELIRRAQPSPVVVMTNYASLRSAVDAMKLGAVDYLAKPCAPEDLLNVVKQALTEHSQARTGPGEPVGENKSAFFEGNCPAIRQLASSVEKVAKTDSTVLILGETGTGKEITARMVHKLSHRAERRMVAVNCAAIPDTLIESELFGYEKGAFTGANSNRVGLIEAADGGTLFLDEIGELPLSAQARLLRFIQEGEIRRIGSVTSRRVNVRLICATHRQLAELSSRNEFRQDLYYRINVLRLEIPPLRARGRDVRDMAEWFAAHLANKMGVQDRKLTEEALRSIESYPWPGNVRELEHAIERGLVMAESGVVHAEDLGLDTAHNQRLLHQRRRESIEAPLITEDDINNGFSEVAEELSLEDYFQRFVMEHQDSMSETELAQKLGISRKCLWERRQRFDLPRSKNEKTKKRA